MKTKEGSFLSAPPPPVTASILAVAIVQAVTQGSWSMSSKRSVPGKSTRHKHHYVATTPLSLFNLSHNHPTFRLPPTCCSSLLLFYLVAGVMRHFLILLKWLQFPTLCYSLANLRFGECQQSVKASCKREISFLTRDGEFDIKCLFTKK